MSKRRQELVGWPAVARTLSENEIVRSTVLARFRAAGFTPDHLRLKPARLALADAVTRAEDALELERPTDRRLALRGSLRALRRQLELSVEE